MSFIFSILASGVTNIFTNAIWDKIKNVSYLGKGYDGANNVENRLFSVDNILPTNIMGDRGEEQFGFRADLYYHHSVMDVFANSIMDNTVQMVVVTGRFASGKSRLVYEYIKSDICPYDNIYIVSVMDTTQKMINEFNNLNPKDSIVVIDDINTHFDESVGEDLGVGGVLRVLSERGIKTLVTLSMGELGYRQFLKNCERGCSVYRGSRHSSVIKIVEIPKIASGDRFHQWCCANLKSGLFSTVVGGYIPNLHRSIDANINCLKRNKQALFLLISFIVGSKYRHNVGRTDWFMRNMYEKKFGMMDDGEFEHALETLKILGFVTDDFEYNGEGRSYKMADNYVFSTFETRCAQGMMGTTIWEVMSNTIEGEKNQCEWLISCDPSSPVLYSRAVVHSKLKETKVYVRKMMESYFKQSGKRMVDVPKSFLEDPIAIMIEFSDLEGYRAMENAVENNNVIPTIEMVSALLRLAPRTMSKEMIVNYAQQLVTRFSLYPSIYYYRCLEIAVDGYDVERVKCVIELYNKSSNDEYSKSNFERYCTDLLCKAVSGSDSDIFWDRIAPMGLIINQKSVQCYCEAVVKKTRNRLTEKIFLNFYENSVKYNWDINRVSVAWELLSCPLPFVFRKKIYEMAVNTLSPGEYYEFALDEDGLKCKYLLPLLGGLSYTRLDDVREAHQLVNELLNSGGENTSEWYASRTKVLNKYLSRMGSYSFFLSELKDLTNGDIKYVDGVTIATAINVVRRMVRNDKKCINVAVDNIRNIIKLQQKYNVQVDPMFNSSLYSVVSKLLEKGVEESVASELIGYAESRFDDENDKARAARISCIFTESDAEKEAESQITELYKNLEAGRYYYNPDFISNLMFVTITRFNKSIPLRKKIETLINYYEKYINIPNHSYYRQLLRYDIMTSGYNVNSANKLIEEINILNDRLLAARIPIIDDGFDLFSVALKSQYIDVKTALMLLHEVDRQSSINPLKKELWRVKLLVNFINKLPDDNGLTDEDINNIVTIKLQGMINRHIDIDYTPEINNIIEVLKLLKKQYHLPSYFALNFPLSSINVKIRHQAWNNYVVTQSLGNIHDTSLKYFIERESKGLEINPYLDDNYLKMALDEQKKRKLLNDI